MTLQGVGYSSCYSISHRLDLLAKIVVSPSACLRLKILFLSVDGAQRFIELLRSWLNTIFFTGIAIALEAESESDSVDSSISSCRRVNGMYSRFRSEIVLARGPRS